MSPGFFPLPPDFYQESAREVAPKLLGHFLLRRTPSGFAGGPIVETEAYLRDDPACHAAKGETARNRSMWGPHGHAYVYLIYGCHYCFNAVCQPKGVAEAVLVRAIEPLFGVEWMRGRRPVPRLHQLTNGPGKLCAALDITRPLDGISLFNPAGELLIAENPQVKRFVKEQKGMVETTRIGISKAKELPLRFYLEGSEFVSMRKKGT